MLRFASFSTLALSASLASAQLVLPFSGTDPSATISAFQIIKSSTSGRASTLYITNVANPSDVLLINTVGFGRAVYATINNSGNALPAVRADSNGTGYGMFGLMSGTGRAGGFRILNAANTNAALYAQTNGSGPALLAVAGSGLAADFQGSISVSSGGISVLTGASPRFPLDFNESLGSKISLWGSDFDANYGLGVAPNLLQIYADDQISGVGIGYGGSGNFTERVRFMGQALMRFLPSGADNESLIEAPYDLVLSRDFDNDDTQELFRLFTDGGQLEQMRVLDGDEADAKFDGAVIANGIDFAEAFKVLDSSIEPGDLVVNYGLDWEMIAKSTKPYDASVIGVVSTKPGFIAGMSFDAEDKIDPELTRRRDAARRAGDEVLEKKLTMRMQELVKQAYRPVAFVGRVPVKVMGPVRVGDRLTASQIPGVAMSMTKAGQSVGIALEPNAGGYGKIMVMVQPGHFTPVATTNPIGDKGLAAKVEQLTAENAALRSQSQDLAARLERVEAILRRLR